MIILIPAYEPDLKLVRLLEAIRATGSIQPIVIVDDGSGPDYADVFDAARALDCDVIGHHPNRGKGAALKLGFAHLATHYPGHDVVCADCDGQHSLVDILRVADAVRHHPASIVLGSRQFSGNVPLKSRFGNSLTRNVFQASTGVALHDTQTGLRGYPASMLEWLQGIAGDHFEYEIEVLLAARRSGIDLHEITIETIYIDGNESSHFDPILDSVRVYWPFLKFSLSSLAAFTIDAIMFFALMAFTGQLLLSVVAARCVSASINFTTNRRLVFRDDRRRSQSAVRYGVLVVALMLVNFLVLEGLTVGLGTPLVAAKLLTELGLFLVSYRAQQRIVFTDTSQIGVDPRPSELPAEPPVIPQVHRVGSPS